jgi:hypothetical protein
MRAFDRDLIRGGHYGQRPCEPHPKAEHMAAPTNAANVKKVLSTRSSAKVRTLLEVKRTFRARREGRDATHSGHKAEPKFCTAALIPAHVEVCYSLLEEEWRALPVDEASTPDK